MNIRLSLFSVLFALLFFKTNAQLEKGNLLLGGSLNFIFSEDFGGNSKSELIGIKTSVHLHKMISDNWAIGGRLGYGYEKPFSIFRKGNLTNTFSIGPSVKWFKPINEHVLFSLEGFAEFGGGRRFGHDDSPSDFLQREISKFLGQSYKVPANSDYWDFFNAGLSPGLVIPIYSKLMVELTYGFIGYSQSSGNRENEIQSISNRNSEFNLNLSTRTGRLSVIWIF